MSPRISYSWIVGLLIFIVYAGCATPSHVVIDPPPLPERVMSARWGSSVEEVKKAIDQDGLRMVPGQNGSASVRALRLGHLPECPCHLQLFFYTPIQEALQGDGDPERSDPLRRRPESVDPEIRETHLLPDGCGPLVMEGRESDHPPEGCFSRAGQLFEWALSRSEP